MKTKETNNFYGMVEQPPFTFHFKTTIVALKKDKRIYKILYFLKEK